MRANPLEGPKKRLFMESRETSASCFASSSSVSGSRNSSSVSAFEARAEASKLIPLKPEDDISVELGESAARFLSESGLLLSNYQVVCLNHDPMMSKTHLAEHTFHSPDSLL